MPPKKSNKKKAPKKRPQKPKEKPTPAAEVEIPLENVGEKPIVDLAELNGSLSEKSRELVEIVEIEGKGRGMVARKDIEQERRFLFQNLYESSFLKNLNHQGTEIVRDSPLAASIYGIEVMPIQYGFKIMRSQMSFRITKLNYYGQ